MDNQNPNHEPQSPLNGTPNQENDPSFNPAGWQNTPEQNQAYSNPYYSGGQPLNTQNTNSGQSYGYQNANPNQTFGYQNANPNQPFGYQNANPNQPFGYQNANPNQPFGYQNANPNQPFGYQNTNPNQTFGYQNVNPDPNQQTAGYSPYNSQSTEQSISLPPRKKAPKWLFGLLAVPVIIILLVVAVFTFAPLKDYVYSTFMSASSYYNHVDSASASNVMEDIKSTVDKIPMLNNATMEDSATKTEVSLSIDEAIKSLLGENVPSDVLAMLDNISSLSLELNQNFKGNKGEVSYLLKQNGNAILTLILKSDIENNKSYLQIPELNTGYIDLSSAMQALADSMYNMNGDTDLGTLFTNTNLQDAMKNIDVQVILDAFDRYLNSLVVGISENGTVEKERNSEVEIGSLKIDCTKLTITLNEQQAGTILLELLEELKKDQELCDFFIDMGLFESAATYEQYINTLISSLKDEMNTMGTTDTMTMDVYVSSGDVIARSISVDGATIFFGYADSGKKTSFEFNVSSMESSTVAIIMDAEEEKGSYKGALTFNEMDKTIMTVDFNNVSFMEDKIGTLNGSFSLSVTDVPMVSFDIDAEAAKGLQKIDFSVRTLGTTLASLHIKTEGVDATDVTLPNTNDKIYDYQDLITNYINDSDLEGLMQTFSDLGFSGFGYTDDVIPDFSDIPSIEDAFNPGTHEDETIPDSNSTEEVATPDPGNDIGESESPVETLNAVEYGLPENAVLDSSGNYYYELSLEEVLATGLAGDIYSLYDTKYDNVVDKIGEVSSKICGSNALSAEQLTSNFTVYGTINIDTKEIIDQTRSCSNTKRWESPDNFMNYVSISYDVITNQVIEISGYVNMDTEGLSQVFELANIVDSSLTSEDYSKMQLEYVSGQPISSIGESSIYIAGTGGEQYFSITHQFN